MTDEIKVTVFRRRNTQSGIWYMQYRVPGTTKKVPRTTGTTKRREAERVAAKWEQDLHEGRYTKASKITWADFRERYEREVVSGFKTTTDDKVSAVFNVLERLTGPAKLVDLTAERISRHQAKMRAAGSAEDTIKSHLSTLGAALSWAVDQGLMAKMPKIKKPKRAKGSKAMKGRPITGEEFERMLAKVPAVLAGEYEKCKRR